MPLNRSLLGAVLAASVTVSSLRGETTALPFYEGFEPVDGGWNPYLEWHSCDHYAGDPYCPDDPVLPPCTNPNLHSRCWGPFKFETWPDRANGGAVYVGERSGRQPIWDPYWASIFHNFDPPTGVGDLHLQVWQHDPASVMCTCECNCDPDGPLYGYPNGRPNYQAQGWICLQTPDRSEAYALGVNSYSSWVYLSWYTKTDGWHRTSVARVNGWRKLEIIVHPYTGGAGDVEFKVNDVVVGQGRRRTSGGDPIAVNRLRLGGDPAMITENRLTNTFEEFRYDEVQLDFVPAPCNTPRMDADGDADVDQEDFGLFQRCLTGADDPGHVLDVLGCHCLDANGDADIDQDDFSAFEACTTGPEIPWVSTPECP